MLSDQTREFMSRVVPWPGATAPGYVDLVWAPAFSGKPFKSLDEFMKMADWANRKETIKDLYYCLSLQAEAAKNHRGGLVAKRHASLALSLKSIWLDIDVKDPPKGYKDLAEALDALQAFRIAADLPPPSAIVHSGGGLHVYWISDRALSKAEWEPYAQGLKALAVKHELRCDAGLTTDAARILRVPDTFNYKTTPPRPVRLLGLREQSLDYDFARSLGFLAVISPMATTVANKTFFINADQPSTPSPLLAALPKDSLAAGLTTYSDQSLDFDNIVNGCAFIRDALKTEGKDYDQPMWNLTTLAATFMEHGHALAHRMGKGHSGYTVESTDKLWDRKSKERKDKGLGYPSCAAIQAAGCKACAICPNFAKGKSPLNLGAPVVATAVEGTVTLIKAPDDLKLPPGYVLNPDGYICAVVPSKKPGAPDHYLQLFYNKFFKPWVQAGPKALNFITTADKGITRKVSIQLELLASSTVMWISLYKQDVIPVHRYKALAEGFMHAWIAQIQDAETALISRPFGWLYTKDDESTERHGFVYGGVIYHDDNTTSPAGVGDLELREYYTPTGSIAPWLKAAKVITDMKRPELDAVIASSFAAPLLVVPAKYGCVLSVFGESGGGKSTAAKVAAAVWGNPKLTKEVGSTTTNSMVEKLGEVNNLPVYRDEIREDEDQKKAYDNLFMASEGVNKGRLNANSTQKKRAHWQTLIIFCSNTSFVDYLSKRQTQTDAGIYRVYEYEFIKSPAGAPGVLSSTSDVDRIMQVLEYNYGMVGAEYAKMLGSNPAEIDRITKKMCDDFEAETKSEQPERYWPATCGILLAGATFANQLGAEIDIPALRAFLLKTYFVNRERCKQANTKGGSQMNTEETLTGFLKAHIGESLWTDTFNQGRGKPAALQVLHGPRVDIPKPINVHWAINDRRLLISRKAFYDYLAVSKTPGATLKRGLKDHYDMAEVFIKMAAGTRYVQTQEFVMIIPVPEGSPLEDVMNIYKQIVKEETKL